MGSCGSKQNFFSHLVFNFPTIYSWIAKTAVIVIGDTKSDILNLISFLSNSIHSNFTFESYEAQPYNLPLIVEDQNHIYFAFHIFFEESPSSNDLLRILLIKQIIEEFSSFCIIQTIKQSHFKTDSKKSIIRNKLIFFKKVFTMDILSSKMITVITKAKPSFTKIYSKVEIQELLNTLSLFPFDKLNIITFSKDKSSNSEFKRLKILNKIKSKALFYINQMKYEVSPYSLYKPLREGKKKKFIPIPGRLYYIQNIRKNCFLFLSGDLEGGDRVTEAKPDFEIRSIFQISKKGLGYILTHEYYRMALFVTDVYKYKNERILEGHLSIMLKSFFKIIETDNGWIFKSKEYKEYVYVSDDMWNGDYMVKTSKNITSKSYFRIKEVDS
ncbi:hypothetical protein SteCoe_9494 [Stentor coeruleus]|uniref:Uncharacterized protein n=1 Tax=Stentor coeruleus TaxID=5963 RepID=A0A1R2CHN8_9CILI|nr:hypothetical protein SteCoe_9494 [Stentor coeruleus]